MAPDNDGAFKVLINALTAKLGRLPTEEEVYDFIFGDQIIREKIWNGK